MTIANIPSSRIIRDDLIPPGGSWSATLEANSVVRIVDIEGRQGVDFLCYNADNSAERYHAPNTIKASGQLFLSKGTVLFSDQANALMSIVEDTCGQHDTIGGCCSAPSNELLYGVHQVKGCRENFLQELAAHGMGRRDVVPNVNFFCSVPVEEDGSLAPGVFVAGRSQPGDYVDLKALRRVLVIVSNCPQINNPCNNGMPTAIRLTVFEADRDL